MISAQHILLGVLGVLALAGHLVGMPAGNAASDTTRETIFHNVVNIGTDLVRDVPEIPPFCDQIGSIEKLRVDIGECQLYVEKEGEGQALVLINGGPGGTHHSFHPSFSRAARFAQVVYYDQRGCGNSDYSKGAGYTVGQAVDDLDKLRAALRISEWTVLGWSYGGLLAQKYLLKYPKHVRGLVLVGASPAVELVLDHSRESEFLCPRELMQIREVFSDTSLSAEQAVYNLQLRGDWKRQNYYRPSPEQMVRLARYEWKHDSAFRSGISSSEDMRPLDVPDVFHGCPVPVLIMEGRWDLTWNADKPAKLQACFPGSRLVMFEKAGHVSFADEPDSFFAALKDFVSGLPPISEPRVAQWKKSVADIYAKLAAEAASVSDSVIFRTQEPAPTDFDMWTFFWAHPNVVEGAKVGIEVRSGLGEEYFTWGPKRISPGESSRSDFWKGQTDPSKLYRKDIVVKFWATRGELEFPPDFTMTFEFYKNKQTVKRIQGIRKAR